MTTMSKFLALIPVVAFAAGCNGMAPAGPSQVSNNDATLSTSGDASAMGSSVKCSGLVDIELTVDNSSDSMLWVNAAYHFSSPVSSLCAAPAWTSDRQEMIVDKANHFRAGFMRFAGGTAILLATGPNGVESKIQLDLNGPSNSIRPGTVCNDVARVVVTVVPKPVWSGIDARIVLQASYGYGGPSSTPCGTAPTWLATRRGLRVSEKNPFQASIDPSDAPTTVTAEAPNGIGGAVTF